MDPSDYNDVSQVADSDSFQDANSALADSQPGETSDDPWSEGHSWGDESLPPLPISPEAMFWDPDPIKRDPMRARFESPPREWAWKTYLMAALWRVYQRISWQIRSRYERYKKTHIVDTREALLEMLEMLESCTQGHPEIIVDTEGFNDYRLECDIIEIYHMPENQLYLVDVWELTGGVFEFQTPSGFSLTKFLESEEHLKLFYDCRSDAQALYKSYDIKIAGVIDISLMMSANQSILYGVGREFRRSLKTAMVDLYERRVIDEFEFQGLKDAKDARDRIRFHEAWARRPLDSRLIDYSQDLRFMGTLYRYLSTQLTSPDWWDAILKLSAFDADFGRSSRYTPGCRMTGETPWAAGYRSDDRRAETRQEAEQAFQDEITRRRLNGHAIRLGDRRYVPDTPIDPGWPAESLTATPAATQSDQTRTVSQSTAHDIPSW